MSEILNLQTLVIADSELEYQPAISWSSCDSQSC